VVVVVVGVVVLVGIESESAWEGYEEPGGLGALTCVYDKARVELELFRDLRGTGMDAVADVDVDIAPDGRGCAGWLCERPQPDCGFEADSESDALSQASSSPHSVIE
jgi:hypothetical protein